MCNDQAEVIKEFKAFPLLMCVLSPSKCALDFLPCFFNTTSLIHFEFIFVYGVQFSSVQSLSHVRLFVTPWIAARQASLSITNTQSSPKLMSIESVMPSSHLILCHPLHLPPSIFPSTRVFSNESALHIRWPKYWSFSFSFSFSISPSNEYSGLISFWIDWLISFRIEF